MALQGGLSSQVEPWPLPGYKHSLQRPEMGATVYKQFKGSGDTLSQTTTQTPTPHFPHPDVAHICTDDKARGQLQI